MPRPPLRRRAWLAVALVLLLAAGAWLYQGLRGGVEYDTTPVTRTRIEANVTAIGTLQPRRYVDVGAQVSGQITRLHVQPGAQVRKGQLLVEIDPSVQQATVDAARAALAGLRAQLADQRAQQRLAEQQHARQLQMDRDGATRQEDLQTAEANKLSAAARIDLLKAQIAQTQATLQADEARLGYTRIYSPMAGTVVSVAPREGQTLNATYQTPHILRVADLSGMTVWTDVSEADVRRVKPDMPVYFTTLGGHADEAPRRWHSRVRQVLPAPPMTESPDAAEGNARSGGAAAASKAVVYTVLFDVDNADGELMPQMTAQVAFVTALAPDALAVPLATLKPQAGQPGSYTVRVLAADGTVATRTLRTGVRNRHLVEVLDGLAPGERVVTGERPRHGLRSFTL